MLDISTLASHHPESSLPFLSKLKEKLQAHLTEASTPDPEQSGFSPGHETEITSVVLVDDLLLLMDGGKTSLLIFLGLSTLVSAFIH